MGAIYRINNHVNGRYYIGQTTRPVKERLAEHERALDAGTHHNKALQRDWTAQNGRGFGCDSEPTPDSLLNEKEQRLIKEDLDPLRGKCYNNMT